MVVTNGSGQAAALLPTFFGRSSAKILISRSLCLRHDVDILRAAEVFWQGFLKIDFQSFQSKEIIRIRL